MSYRVGLIALALLAGCPSPRMNPSTDPSAVRVVDGEIDARRLLGEAVDVATAAGAVGLDLVGARVVAEGEQLGSFAEVPAGACILALAAPGESVRDVDLFIYGDDGARLGGDESPAGRAAAMVCPPHPQRVYVTARAMAGEGFVALAVMQVSPDLADAVAQAVHVRGRPGEDTGKLAAWPGLEQTIREHRRALGSEWEDVRRAAIPVDPAAATAVSITVAPQRCLDVLVVPSDDVPSVTVQLVDEDGRVVSRGRPPGRNRSVLVCSDIERTLTLLVRPRASTGLVAVAIARTRPGAGTELFAHPSVLAPAPIGTLERAVDGWRASTDAWGGEVTDEGIVEVPTTSAGTRELAVEPGCTRVGIVGEPPLGPFDATLWGPDQRELDRGPGTRWANLFHCAETPTTLALEVLASARAGRATILARRTDAPARLTQHPLAAGRLLRRIDDAGMLGDPADLRLALVAAAPRRQVVVPVPELEQGCMLWSHAVAGDAQGLRLRLFAQGARLQRMERGLGVVATPICPEDDVVRATIEVDEAATTVVGASVSIPKD